MGTLLWICWAQSSHPPTKVLYVGVENVDKKPRGQFKQCMSTYLGKLIYFRPFIIFSRQINDTEDVDHIFLENHLLVNFLANHTNQLHLPQIAIGIPSSVYIFVWV